MPGVGIGVHPAPVRRGTIDSRFDLIRHTDATQGHVATRNALGKLHDIGLDTPVFEPKPGARAPKSGDHFVADEQHVVFVADLSNAWEIVVLRHNHPASSLHGLSDKGPYRVRPFPQNGLFEQIGRRHALSGRGIAPLEAVWIRRGNMYKIGHAW